MNRLIALLIVTQFVGGPVLAHTGHAETGGLVSGFLHPLFGLDHVVAMIDVGLWGAILGRPALYLLPLVFPVVMAFGGAMGIADIPLPAVEKGIALSGLVIGLLVALAAPAPMWVATVIVGGFAIFHGHAHGTELPAATNPFAYAVGFVTATGLLHLVGIAIGHVWDKPWGKWAVRSAGVFVAAVGAAFLVGMA